MSSPYYQDESVKLYHGDCRELTEWLEADILVTDPPYGMAYVSGWRPNAIQGDHSLTLRDIALELWQDRDFDSPLRDDSALRPALVFGTWRVGRPLGTRALLVWDKGEWPGMGDLKLPWGSSHEEIYVIGSGFAGAREGTVLRSNRLAATGTSTPDHPTPKPVSLMERLIAKCPPGIVADPFAGSGSTLVAAKQLGRKAIGVELEERYCEVIAKRLSQGVLDFGSAS